MDCSVTEMQFLYALEKKKQLVWPTLLLCLFYCDNLEQISISKMRLEEISVKFCEIAKEEEEFIYTLTYLKILWGVMFSRVYINLNACLRGHGLVTGDLDKQSLWNKTCPHFFSKHLLMFKAGWITHHILLPDKAIWTPCKQEGKSKMSRTTCSHVKPCD